MQLLKYIIIIIFGISLTDASNGQQIRYLNIKDGLSNRQINGIEKDHKGLLWFATNDGIDRYDGNEFRNYKLHSSVINPSGLGYRFNVLCDTSGVIWAYTTSGRIFRYDQWTDNFELKIDLKEEIEINKTGFYVNTLHFDSSNTLWIGTTTGTYNARFSGSELRGLYFIRGLTSHAFADSDAGYLWEGTEKGVSRLNSAESIQEKPFIDDLYNATKTIRVSCLFYDSKNHKLWIGSMNNGLSVYDFNQKELIDLSNSAPHVPIRSIVKNSHGEIFVGFDGAGIRTYDALDYRPGESWLAAQEDNGLSDNSVYDIYCDQDDRIWICTYTAGVTIIDFHKPKMQFFKHQNNNDKSLRNNPVLSTLEDSDGEIWFGTSSGVSVFNRQKGTWDHLHKLNNSKEISDYKILALAEDDRKRIWIGGYGNGLHIYDKNSKTLSHLTNDVAGDVFIGSVYNDHNGSMWFGGTEGFLSRLEMKTGKISKYNIRNVTVVTGKAVNQVWVGTTEGLFIADSKTDSVFNYSEFSGGLKEISNTYINCLYQDKSGSLWIGTNGGGVNFFNPEKNQILLISTDNGLPSNFIKGIFSDKIGRIWISTDKGIACFDTDAKNSINYGFIENFTNFPFSRNSCSGMKSGEFVIGGFSGAIVFAPELIKPYTSKSRLLFNEFKISYQKVLPGETGSPLTQPLDLVEKITLENDQNSFSFSFSSINYDNTSKLAYQWKLEGFEKEWSPLTTNKTAGYTNIPSGDYLFKVRCFTQNSQMYDDERMIRLIVRPPFWNTQIAYVFYIIFLFSLLWIIYSMDQTRLQKRHASDKIKFFINTTHDIKTPLSLIKAPLKNLESDKGITSQGLYFLQLAQSNADKLTRIVNQVLDFEKSGANKPQLLLTNNNLASYFNEKIPSYLQLTKDHEIHLEYEFPDFECFAMFDVDKMDKIIDNLFSNAVKYTPSGGHIRFYVRVNEKEWMLEISDTGIGIPKKDRRDLFKMYYRAENAVNSKISGTGIGLMLVQNLIKMHEGRISFTSQENKGSTFLVNFPRNIVPKNTNNQKTPAKVEASHENTIAENEITMFQIPEISKSSYKILVVEDDIELRNYLACALGKKFHVTCAEDGLKALELFRKVRFDLVISDVIMPNMKGDELCRRIKSDITTSHIPVILLTALSDKKNTINGLEAGADSYIDKPFDMDLVDARINNILKNRHLISESLIKGVLPNSGKVNLNGLDKTIIREILAIVERELSNPDFSIDDLCRETAMSRTLLYNKIKVHSDLAPNEFIRVIRMNKAMDFLKSGKMPVSEIAEKVGFPDSKYFSTAFKKFFGKSPKHYLGNDKEDIPEA